MSSQTQIERQHVYWTYRKLFCGKAGRVRKSKAIRGIVLKHWAISGTDDVDDSYLEKTIPVIKTLLRECVFESEERAKKEFPELFAESPQIKYADNSSRRSNTSPKRSTDNKHTERNDSIRKLGQDISSGASTIRVVPAIRTPLALGCLRFPIDVQHRILSEVQQLLEESCFRFIKKWIPSALKENGWDCAAAVELTRSLPFITKRMKDLPESCMDVTKQASFKRTARVVAQIRHAAVHRLRLRSDEFLRRICSASKLVELMQHKEDMVVLQTMYTQVYAYVKKMEHDAEAMKHRTDYTLSKILKEREALAQKEQNLQESIAQQQIDISVAAGKALFESINALLPTCKPDEAIGRELMIRGNKTSEFTGYDLAVDENDIESDEDRLQAELG